MNGKDYSRYEEILDEIEELRELSQDFPIIVEGKKDEAALRRLGINGEFLQVSNGLPLYEFCEGIAKNYSDVILLTDLDGAGEKITKRLKSYLSQMGVRTNERFRLNLLNKLETHQVESLYARMKRIEGKLF
jgi:5S rRNA maturation endonuclease (ribonuclease M5)